MKLKNRTYECLHELKILVTDLVLFCLNYPGEIRSKVFISFGIHRLAADNPCYFLLQL